MSDYIRREPTILSINMAMDKFPYEKDPQRPETYSKYNEGWSDACDYILAMIEAESIADAVPVVRCKDCKFRDGAPGQPNIICWNMKDDDFCSYGEKAK